MSKRRDVLLFFRSTDTDLAVNRAHQVSAATLGLTLPLSLPAIKVDR